MGLKWVEHPFRKTYVALKWKKQNKNSHSYRIHVDFYWLKIRRKNNFFSCRMERKQYAKSLNLYPFKGFVFVLDYKKTIWQY